MAHSGSSKLRSLRRSAVFQKIAVGLLGVYLLGTSVGFWLMHLRLSETEYSVCVIAEVQRRMIRLKDWEDLIDASINGE